LICSILVQAVCSTCGVRRSPRTSINAVMTAMRRSSHSEALRMYHSSSRPFSRVSERMCKQVSVSLPYRGDSHDDQYDDYTGVAGSTSC
jgi:hypothetical protein